MKYRKRWGWITAIGILAALIVFVMMHAQRTPRGQESGKLSGQYTLAKRVTMIDLGATECIPCKMMAPILEELKKEYAGRADIIFIDVWKNPYQAEKYGIRTIPTQIFYDQDGKEFYRHVGFLDRTRIIDVLSRLGVSKVSDR